MADSTDRRQREINLKVEFDTRLSMHQAVIHALPKPRPASPSATTQKKSPPKP